MPNTNPLELLNAYIKEHKLRHTYERERVLEYILTIDGHFTVQSVHEQMNVELEKGYADIAAGHGKDAKSAFSDIRRDYGL